MIFDITLARNLIYVVKLNKFKTMKYLIELEKIDNEVVKNWITSNCSPFDDNVLDKEIELLNQRNQNKKLSEYFKDFPSIKTVKFIFDDGSICFGEEGMECQMCLKLINDQEVNIDFGLSLPHEYEGYDIWININESDIVGDKEKKIFKQLISNLLFDGESWIEEHEFNNIFEFTNPNV